MPGLPAFLVGEAGNYGGMEESPAPVPDLLKKLSLVAGIELPGQTIVVAAIEAGTAYRQTMSQENRDVYDKMQITMTRNIHNGVWLPLLKAIGLEMEKI